MARKKKPTEAQERQRALSYIVKITEGYSANVASCRVKLYKGLRDSDDKHLERAVAAADKLAATLRHIMRNIK